MDKLTVSNQLLSDVCQIIGSTLFKNLSTVLKAGDKVVFNVPEMDEAERFEQGVSAALALFNQPSTLTDGLREYIDCFAHMGPLANMLLGGAIADAGEIQVNPVLQWGAEYEVIGTTEIAPDDEGGAEKPDLYAPDAILRAPDGTTLGVWSGTLMLLGLTINGRPSDEVLLESGLTEPADQPA